MSRGSTHPRPRSIRHIGEDFRGRTADAGLLAGDRKHEVSLEGGMLFLEPGKAVAGRLQHGLELVGIQDWRGDGLEPIEIEGVRASTTDQMVEIEIPAILTADNPTHIAFEWGSDGRVR